MWSTAKNITRRVVETVVASIAMAAGKKLIQWIVIGFALGTTTVTAPYVAQFDKISCKMCCKVIITIKCEGHI